ncbi:MAG: RNA-binding S4 domain-containing protein [Acidobacteria bacterium]|nr:RNA-binding S4 domain-containing protein [Acidobacteriota bacterium]
MIPDSSGLASVRLDTWLDVACLCRTRSEAQKACQGGKVDVNGQAAKPHRLIRAGDELQISRPPGRRQIVVVRQLVDHHVARAQARQLYEDRTPPPSPDEIEARRLERMFRAATRAQPGRAPTKRDRREILKLKGR